MDPLNFFQFDFFYNFIFALLASVSRVIMLVIYKEQDKPYMDEVFHVPQARQYCNANFSHWDPMITTLPGLYLTSVGLLKPIDILFKADTCEHLYWLRCTNLVFCLASFYVISIIILKLKKPNESLSSQRSTLLALNITTLPVLYFFTFLYYTDFGSTFFVMFSYYFHLHNNHGMAALMGGISIIFRQTNVVWVVFLAWLAFIPILNGKRKIKLRSSNDRHNLETTSDPVVNIKLILKSLRLSNMKAIFTLVEDFVDYVLPYCLVIIAFITFLWLNNGIVVGAKADHQATFHLCQLLYFSAFSFFFVLPSISPMDTIFDFIRHLRKNAIALSIGLLVILAIIHNTTMAHKYLLADNRHYTFYIWKNIFQRHWCIRYLLAPVYLFSTFSLWRLLKSADVLWKLGYLVCLSVALVPAPLIEFRYFIVPFLFLRLSVSNLGSNYIRVVSEFLFYTVINVCTLSLFVMKTFKWPDSNDNQRFMF